MNGQLIGAPSKCVINAAPCYDFSMASHIGSADITDPRDRQTRFFMNKCSTNLTEQPNWCGGKCKDIIKTPILGGAKVSGSERGMVYCPFGINGGNPPSIFAAPTESLVPQMNPRPLNKVGWEWRN